MHPTQLKGSHKTRIDDLHQKDIDDNSPDKYGFIDILQLVSNIDYSVFSGNCIRNRQSGDDRYPQIQGHQTYYIPYYTQYNKFGVLVSGRL